MPTPHRLLAASLCALPLVLTACGDDGPQPSAAPAPPSAAVSSPPPTATDVPTAEPTRVREPSQEPTRTPAAGAETSGDYKVDAERVQGITLVTYGEAAGGSARQVTGRLVTGPGGCLSLSQQDRPELLVFPEDTRLTPGRPSVQLPGGNRVYVGDRFSVSIAELSLSQLSGLPRRCQQGASDVAQEVAG